jgi:hypothetical protein
VVLLGRITRDDSHRPAAVTVDGQPVEVPAGGDPATLALALVAEQARRESCDVRAVIVDDRDDWEHRLTARSDGEIDEDLARPDRAPAPRRWYRRVPAVARVLLAGGAAAVDSGRAET